MATLSRISLVLALLFPGMASAATYYVATNGSDSNNGTNTGTPLLTISRAYSKARSGDVISLRGGTYREQVNLTNESGITLCAYGTEAPVISGLDILNLTWTKTTNTSSTNNAVVYMATYTAATNSDFTNPATRPILQLFYNGKPMLQARWPNCPTNADGSWNFFSSNSWASVNPNGNSYGTISDSNLASLPSSINGAMAVLNVNHQYWTWTRGATNHTAGGITFSYSQDLGSTINTNQSFDDDFYYLFGQMQFLDAPGEWFYDGTNKLYVMTPDGTSPTNGVLEIKTRQVGFTADNTCSNLTVQGITFLGTAFKFGGGYYTSKCSNISLISNTVTNSSWTEYLRMNSGANGALQDSLQPTIYGDNCRVVNNTFSSGALSGLLIHGFSNVIENNSFSYFDYSSSLDFPPLRVNQPWPGLTNTAGNCVVRYNSLAQSGGIQLQVAHGTNDVYLNDASDSYLACYGGNKDTSVIYFQNYFISGTRVHHNWVRVGYSGTPPQPWGGGLGIRGDDSTCGATVDHNVTWNLGGGGIQLKNTNTVTNPNQCLNNTVFNDSAYNNGTNSAIIIRTTGYAGENSNAIVANNLATTIRGDWGKALGQVALLASNVTANNPGSLLVSASTNTNAAWVDFRPASNASALINVGSTNAQINTNLPGITSCTTWPILNTNGSGLTDVGAYERGDAVYWIPGQRLAQASGPIIPSGSTGIAKSRDVLMWRPAYGAASHNVYFGTNTNSWSTNQSFTGENNIFALPTNLASGTAYYWRVDAVMTNGSTNAGGIWSFSTTPAFTFPSAKITNTYTGIGIAATLNNVGTVPVIITYNGSTNLPINAGSYTVIATVADTNNYSYYSRTNTMVIAKATPVFTFASNSLSQSYTGSGIAVSLTNAGSTPVSITYNGSNNAPTNAGSYTVVATVTDTNNYNAYSATNTMAITKATPVFTFASNSLSGVYTGSNFTVSLTNAGSVPVSITYNGSSNAPTNAGSYTVVATATDTNNYTSYSVTNTLTIAQAFASVSFSGTNATYDGTAKNVTVTTTPSGLSSSVTYNGSSNAPTNAGSYPVVCVASNSNYLGSNSTTLVIAKASNTITFPSPSTLIYTASITNSSTALGATASSGQQVSYTSLSTNLISISGSNATALGSGTALIVASQSGNGNYLAATPVTNVMVIVSFPNWQWSTNPSSGSLNDAGSWTSSVTPANSTNTLLNFSNSSITELTNNLSSYTFGGITFSTNASAYNIGGNGFMLGSSVTNANGAFILNSSTNTESFNVVITLATNAAFTNTDVAGTMVFNGGITQKSNTLTLSGGSFQFGGSNSSAYTNSSSALLNLKSGTLTIANGGSFTATNGPSSYVSLANFGGNSAIMNVSLGGVINVSQLYMQAFASNATNYVTNSGTLTVSNLYLMGYNTNVTGGTNQFVQATGASTIGLLKIGGGNQGQGTGATNRLSQNALNTVQVTGGILNATNYIYMGANAINSTNQLIITGGQVSAIANGIVFGPSSTTKEGATNVLNQITLGGGTISVSKIGYSSSNAVSGVINSMTWSNGGVLQAMSNIGANFMATSTVTGNKTMAVSMGANGGIFDVNGLTNTIGVNLADETTNNSGSLTVTNSSTNAGQLTLSGTNTFTGLTLNGANLTVNLTNGSFSSGSTNGPLNLAAGTLNIGANNITNSSITIGNGLISGSGTLTAGSGGFTFTNSANQTISNVLAGAGGLLMNGTGTVTFNTNATYVGNTTVNSGTLLLNGSNVPVGTSGTNTINSGGNLMGIGTAGTVIVNGGASLTPGVGSATGTLSVGGLKVNTGGTLNISLGGSTTSQLSVNGNAVLGGTINFTTSSALTAPAYTFLTVTNGTVSGTFAQVTNLPTGYLLSYSSNTVLITQASNTINFPALGSVIYSNGLTVVLGASASSGLTVSYVSPSTNISIVGTTVNILGAGTASIVASQAGGGIYPVATPVTNTLVITKGVPTFTFVSNSLSNVYTGSNVAVTLTNAGSTPYVITYNGSTNPPSGAGTYTVVATVTDTNNYNAYSVTNALVIGKGNATISFSGTNATYDGTAKSVVALTVPTNLSVGITYNGSTNAPTNAGSYTVVATVADANYVGSNSTTLTIGQASNAIAWTNLVTPVSYSNGLVIGLGATASSGLGVSYSSANTNLVSISGTNLAVLGAGTASIVASQAGNSNYLAATPVTNTLVIGKGSASVSITGTNAIYDGTAKSVVASTVPTNLNVGITYNGSSNAPSNAGSYTVVATVADANYAGSNTATLMIGQATSPTFTFVSNSLSNVYTGSNVAVTLTNAGSTPYVITYNGSTNPPSGAGTYTVVATVTDTNNYNAYSVTNALVIGKGNATISFSGTNATYDGTAKSVVASTVPTNLSVGITYNGSSNAPSNAGSYTVVATVAVANYVGSNSTTLTIGQASNVITWTNLVSPVSYTNGLTVGLGATASSGLAVSYSSASTNVSISGTNVTVLGAGTATLVATQAGNSNYLAATPVTNTLVIGKVTAGVSISNTNATYDGTAKAVTVTTTPAGLSTSVTYNGSSNAPSNAGSYTVVATVADANYAGSNSTTLTIGQASNVVTWTNLVSPVSYSNGLTVGLGATASSGLAVSYSSASTNVSISGTNVTVLGAGTATLVATQAGNSNYLAATPVTNALVIGKGNATISFSGTNATYDGTAKSVVASTVPTNLSVGITYNGSSNAPSNAGSYTVVATVADANYAGSNSTTLTIGQASNAIAWTNLVSPVSYSNGLIIGLGATASSGLAVSYSSSSTNVSISGTNVTALGAGTASIVANQSGNSNYLAATPVTNALVIGKGNATISFSGTNATYDGTAKSVVASTVPTNLSVGITYNGSTNAPTNAGSYTVVATVADANYTGSDTSTLTIAQATNTIIFPILGSRFYTNGIVIGLGALASSGLSVSYSSASTNVSISGTNLEVLGAGTASIVAAQAGNSNYLAATPVTNSLVISNAATPTNVPVIYEHGWTGWIGPTENR